MASKQPNRNMRVGCRVEIVDDGPKETTPHVSRLWLHNPLNLKNEETRKPDWATEQRQRVLLEVIRLGEALEVEFAPTQQLEMFRRQTSHVPADTFSLVFSLNTYISAVSTKISRWKK